MQLKNILLSILLWATVVACSLASDLQSGINSYDIGDYKVAIDTLLPLAESGNSEAQDYVGRIYAVGGNGIEQDLDDAISWFRKAAEQNQPQAQTNLGRMYKHGFSVEKDYSEAFIWFRRASSQGNSAGQYELGLMYEKGYWVEKDEQEAFRLFLHSAENGYAKAQITVGNSYDKGKGVAEDDTKAAHWYQKAADQGSDVGLHNLGIMYLNGAGVEKNVEKGLSLIRNSAEMGYTLAQHNLGVLYYQGRVVAKDFKESFFWHKKAAEQGNEDSQEEVSIAYALGRGVEQNDSKAVYWMKKSHLEGKEHYPGRNEVGYVEHWIGVTMTVMAISSKSHISRTEGLRWNKIAAELGNTAAQGGLAWSYATGDDGLPEDYVLAYMWANLSGTKRSLIGMRPIEDFKESLRELMTRYQIAEAQRLSRNWKRKTPEELYGAQREASEPKERGKKQSNEDQPYATGTGFRVDKSGKVLTNNHVVENCSPVKVNGDSVAVISTDPANDLALLQYVASSSYSHFRTGRGIRLGDKIVVTGYPLRGLFGGGLNVSTGTVAALSGIGNDSRELQITAPVNSGNSGGPLLDSSGNVVGVIVSKVNAIKSAELLGDVVQGANFAIKSSVVQSFLDMNNVDYGVAVSSEIKPTADIAEEAKDYTVLVECWK